MLLPGVAGADNLQPFYDIISDAIRSVDKNHIIMYEPVTWGMIFNGTVSGSGFTAVPGGDNFKNTSLFSFHYYCWWFTDGGELDKETCDEMFGPKVFSQVEEDISNVGGSMMLTEWGQGCDPASGLVDECNAIMNLADTYLTSWVSWYFFPNVNVWYVPPQSIDVFSRTYAKRIAGVPSLMKFNATNLQFDLCYSINPSVTEPTEIYANFALHYPSGVLVRVGGGASQAITVSVQESDNLIYLYFNKSTSITNENCCIGISKR